ncbi:MAG: class B sortase [Lachnospiraceae bacterium]|nr:class B sortase [Lachnospiraceae bacterium]
MSDDSCGRKSEDGTYDSTVRRDSNGEERRKSINEGHRDRTIDGMAIPDKPIIDWNELSKSGKDIVAWLDIPALGIAYPIVQGDDNEFYLHHLPNGEYKNAGSLFMEAANSPDLTDVNTIIYGHNMDNGSMFGKFRNMTEKEYKTQPFLWLCTKEKS